MGASLEILRKNQFFSNKTKMRKANDDVTLSQGLGTFCQPPPPFICPKRGVAQLHLASSSQAGTYEPL